MSANPYFYPSVSPKGIIRDQVSTTQFTGRVLTIPVYEPPIESVPLQKLGSIIQLRGTNEFYRAGVNQWITFTTDPTIFQLISEGSGMVSIVASSPGPNLEVNSISPGTGITFSPSITEIPIVNSGLLSVTSGTSPGSSLLTSDSTASVVKVRTILGVSGLTSSVVGVDQANLSIDPLSNAVTQSITTATPIPPFSLPMIADDTNPSITMKSLASYTYTDVVDGGTYIQLNVTFPDPPAGDTLVSTGGQSLVSNGTGPALVMKGLTAGTNVVITDNGTDLMIDADFGPITPNIDSVIAGGGITVSPPSGTGNVTIGSSYINGAGFFAYLNANLGVPANTDIKAPGIWTLQWDNGGLFDNGTAVINNPGTYVVSWAVCNQSTSVSTSLCVNGLIWSSQNAQDSDSQGVNAGCVTLQLQIGDVVSLRNNESNTVYYRVRGNSPPTGATYISVIRLADITEVNNTTTPGGFQYLNTDITSTQDLPIQSPSAINWTAQWSSGLIWSKGIVTISVQGAYFLSWAICTQGIGTTTSLTINGYIIQSQNAFDSDSQGVNSGSGFFYLNVGDTIAMVSNSSEDVYYRVRGNAPPTGATYVSYARVPTWL